MLKYMIVFIIFLIITVTSLDYARVDDANEML